MRFSTILAFAMPTVFGAATPQDEIVGGYFRNLGKLQRFLMSIEVVPQADFTAEDLVKIQQKLSDPKVLSDALIREVASFNATDLSVPEKEAEEAILKLVQDVNGAFQRRVYNAVTKKTGPNEIEETKRGIRMAVDALVKVENYDKKLLQKAERVLNEHPELAATSRILIAANRGLFDKEVLDYINLTFTTINEYNPEVADKLIDISNILQKKYKLAPADYYKKVQLAFAGKSSY